MLDFSFTGGAVIKNLPANAGGTKDVVSIPGSGRSPGGGHGNPLSCSCLENPMDLEELSRLQSTGLQRVRCQPKRLRISSLFARSCQTLCDPMDCSLSGSFVRGFLQARILEWVAIPFCKRSSQPRDQTQVLCTEGRFFTSEPSGSPYHSLYIYI